VRLAIPLAGLLLAALPLTAQVPAASSTAKSWFRVKQVKLIDAHGFERPMPAFSLLIPADWQFKGDTLWGTVSGCNADMVRGVFQATSPDGKVVYEALPGFAWQYSDDPFSQRTLAASNQQMAAFGRKPCPVMPPLAAADLLRQSVLPKFRAGKRVVTIEAMPQFNQELAAQARQTEALWAKGGMPIRIRSDAARAWLQYDLGGQPVEEWVMAESTCSVQAMPSTAAMMGQAGPRQAGFYDCQALYTLALRAPQGQLQGKEKLFDLMRSTIRLEPEWSNRVAEATMKVAAIQQKGVMDRAEIVRKTNEDISRMIIDGHNERQRIQEQSVEEYDRQVIRGVQTYRNPSTGDTFELSNQYNHAWMNGGNEYILTDDPNFNPNSRFSGNWTSLEPVRPH
jgi:hypothetical protein